jgi:SAM-dependent methyltransferase
MRQGMPPLTFMAWLRWDLIRVALAPVKGPVLEVGCGQGAMGARLAARLPYTGVEPDPVSAAVARERISGFPGAVVEEGALEEVGTGAYHAVCAFEVLEHIEDDEAALTLWSSHVRPGGRLVLSVPAWQHRFGSTDEHVGHYRRYDPTELAQLLTRTGFVVESVRQYGFPLGYALEWVRNRITTGQPAEPASMLERSHSSGRFLQPRRWLASVPWLVTLPFRAMQRLVGSRAGTGIVAVATRVG